MSKESTLQKVEQEIDEGKLRIARDRLKGLISTYRSDLNLRSRLGDVYDALGQLPEAGRWWFFDESPSNEKLSAIALFIKRCKGHLSVMLRMLRLPDASLEEVARRRAMELAAECKRRGIAMPAIKRGYVYDRKRERLLDRCCLILTALLILFAAFCCLLPFQR